jgi:hypothetical protein
MEDDHLSFLNKYVGAQACQGMSFVPRRHLNIADNEVARALRHTGRTAEYVSFSLPRRFGNLSQPPVAEAPQISHDDWAAAEPRDSQDQESQGVEV